MIFHDASMKYIIGSYGRFDIRQNFCELSQRNNCPVSLTTRETLGIMPRCETGYLEVGLDRVIHGECSVRSERDTPRRSNGISHALFSVASPLGQDFRLDS